MDNEPITMPEFKLDYSGSKFTKESLDAAMREQVCKPFGLEGHHAADYDLRIDGVLGYLKCSKCKQEVKLNLIELDEEPQEFF